MEKSNRKITFKVIIGYIILVSVAIAAAYLVFSEIKHFISLQRDDASDRNKVINVGNLIADIYENESIARAAIQEGSQKRFELYVQKNDALNNSIDSLALKLDNQAQVQLLDSVKLLLSTKFSNIEALKRIKQDNISERSIDNALLKINKIETSIGRLTIQDFAKNPDELTPEVRQSIEEYIAILNKYNPNNETSNISQKQLDSIVVAARDMLKQIKKDALTQRNNLSEKESNLIKSDLDVSQKLRRLLFNLEREILDYTKRLNEERDQALDRSIKILSLAAILGLVLIILFSFIILNDFWKSQQYRRDLEKANAFTSSLLHSREQLISMVSHDLRTPLSTVFSYSELLDHISKDSKTSYYVDRIKKAANYMKQLVDDLLEYSKLERGKITIEHIPFQIKPIIDEVVTSVTSVYPNKNLELILEHDKAINAPINGDPFRIRQILYNLIGNAYKFTETGSIKITTKYTEKSKDNHILNITITDTGIGIPQEKQSVIFEEFTQAEGDTDKKYGGFGLGLTISKKLATLLNGTLTFTSKPNQGSTFTLALPVVFTKKEIKKAKPVQQVLAPNLHIVMVDDDASLRQLITDILKTQNLKVTTFETANKALKKLKNMDFDLVLTDIQLPKMNGFHFMETLKKAPYYKSQPIIAATGRKNLNAEVYTESGFSDIIFKPFSVEDILACLTKWLPKAQISAPKSTATNATAFKHINIKPISSFLGNDEESLKDTLLLFLNETKHNLETLEKKVNTNDLKGINEVSHKMQTMFKQLEIATAIPHLTYLENITELDKKRISDAFEALQTISQPVIQEIETFIN
ncbi:ATP-binding response regulator [Formosa sp. A9]|uniref:hybrid sensor histidine kinase/response regulator n=1 Tax=Formosa sp. A9 TaxID=3442641 RepID=UPI003EBE58C8